MLQCLFWTGNLEESWFKNKTKKTLNKNHNPTKAHKYSVSISIFYSSFKLVIPIFFGKTKVS